MGSARALRAPRVGPPPLRGATRSAECGSGLTPLSLCRKQRGRLPWRQKLLYEGAGRLSVGRSGRRALCKGAGAAGRDDSQGEGNSWGRGSGNALEPLPAPAVPGDLAGSAALEKGKADGRARCRGA